MKRILFGADSKQPASSHVAQSTTASANPTSSQAAFTNPQQSPTTSNSQDSFPNPNPHFLSAHSNLNPNASIRSTSYASSIHSSSNYFDQQHFNNPTSSSSPSTPFQSVPIPGGQSSIDFIPTPVGPSINPDSSSSSNQQQQQLDAQYGIERTDLHKSLKSLESLLVSLDEYRDLSNKLAKVEKRIAKNSTELARGKAVKEIPAQTLLASSALFESLTETSSKHSKYLQKEYESLNEACGKFFKKIAKEEKVQDETLETLDSKIKRAQVSYEKSSKSKSNIGIKAVESHDKYMNLIGGLSNEMAVKKKDHSISTGLKNHSINLLIASTLGGLADARFKKLCEEVRKSGSHIGRLNEWLNFCLMACNNPSESMPNGQPVYLDEDEFGLATKLVQMQSLLYNQAQNNALKQAELFNKEQIKEEDLLRAKEEDLRQEELARKAREMGWTPPTTTNNNTQNREDAQSMRKSNASPSDQQQQQSVQFSDLPRLDSSGLELKPTSSKEASSPGGGKSNNTSISTTSNSNSNSNSILNNSMSNMMSLDNGNSNHGSTGGTSIETSANDSRSGSASGPGSHTLNRNETLQSSKAEPQSWETENEKEQLVLRSTSPTNSNHEGTVVDKGENNDNGIEDDSQSHSFGMRSTVPSGESKGILQNANDNAESKEPKLSFQEPNTSKPTSNTQPTASPLSEKNSELEPRPHTSEASTPTNLERKRTTSLWERERERSKVLDRERELSSKLNDFKSESNRDRSFGGLADRREYNYSRESTPRASVGYSSAGITAGESSNIGNASGTSGVLDRPRPTRYSLDSSNRAGVGIGSFNKHNNGIASANPTSGNGVGYLYRQETIDQSQLPQAEERDGSTTATRDQYAPSVGKSKLNGGAVNRSLSTDTTASERSFVARMKAKYQAEKDRDRERELMDRDRERQVGGYQNHTHEYDQDRRVSTPPNLPTNTRRVSDLAAQYNSNSDRDRSWALSPSAIPQTLPRDHRDRLPPTQTDEFGALRNPPRSPRSNQGQGDSDEVPHSSVCGCARCSAIKYAASNPSPSPQHSQGRISPNPGRVSPSYNQGYSSVKSRQGMSQMPTSNSNSSMTAQSQNRLRPQPHYDSHSYNNGRSIGGSGFSNTSSTNNYDRGYESRDYPLSPPSEVGNSSRRDRDFAPPPITSQREPNVRRQSLPPPKPSLEPPATEREYGTFVRGYGGDRVGDRLMEENLYARRSFERS